MANLIGLVVYLGFGVAMHAFMLGAVIDPYSAWSIGWIVGWPILLFAIFFKWFLILAAVVVVAVGLWMLWDNIWFRFYRNEARKNRKGTAR